MLGFAHCSDLEVVIHLSFCGYAGNSYRNYVPFYKQIYSRIPDFVPNLFRKREVGVKGDKAIG